MSSLRTALHIRYTVCGLSSLPPAKALQGSSTDGLIQTPAAGQNCECTPARKRKADATGDSDAHRSSDARATRFHQPRHAGRCMVMALYHDSAYMPNSIGIWLPIFSVFTE